MSNNKKAKTHFGPTPLVEREGFRKDINKIAKKDGLAAARVYLYIALIIDTCDSYNQVVPHIRWVHANVHKKSPYFEGVLANLLEPESADKGGAL